jgi:hypothetical protein
MMVRNVVACSLVLRRLARWVVVRGALIIVQHTSRRQPHSFSSLAAAAFAGHRLRFPNNNNNALFLNTTLPFPFQFRKRGTIWTKRTTGGWTWLSWSGRKSLLRMILTLLFSRPAAAAHRLSLQRLTRARTTFARRRRQQRTFTLY